MSFATPSARRHPFAASVARLALITLFAVHVAAPASAQMSGSYTVGGSAPDFATPDDAAAALIAEGVSGPVTIGIRPGTYMPSSAGQPVLNLGEQIGGVSTVNRVTFGPDAPSGGTVETVTFRTISAPEHHYDPSLVRIASDYVTFRNVTLEMADDSGTQLAGPMVSVGLNLPTTSVNGVHITGNRLFGRVASSTTYAGIHVLDSGSSGVISDNTINGIWTGILLAKPTTGYEISGNTLTGLAGASVSTAYETGAINTEHADNLSVHDNVIDYGGTGGNAYGIRVREGGSFDIRANEIKSFPPGGGLAPHDTFVAIEIFDSTPAGGTIANNMVAMSWASSRWGIRVRGDNVNVVHNSILHPARGIDCLFGREASINIVAGTGMVVTNNLLVDFTESCESVAAIIVGDTTGNVFDANNVHAPEIGHAFANGSKYGSLGAWQLAGYGENSSNILPDFVADRDLHLGECSVVDEDLRLTSYGLVPNDIDGDTRDVTAPFAGADEPVTEIPDLFQGPTNYSSGARSFHAAAGDVDGDGDEDILVTNPASDGVSGDLVILWNDGDGTFPTSDSFPVGSSPNFVRTGHLNGDSVPDIVVAGSESVELRYGVANAAPTAPISISDDPVSTTDIEIGDFDIDGDEDIFYLSSPSTDSAKVSVAINDGDGTHTFSDAWSVGRWGDDFELVDLDADGLLDIVVANAHNPGALYTLRNRGVDAPGLSKGFEPAVEYLVGGSSTGTSSKLNVADFDGDLAPDIVLGAAFSDSLLILRNLGDGTFGPRETFYGDGKGAPVLASKLDYDGDGDLDLIVATSQSTLELLLNDGTAGFTRFLTCLNDPFDGAGLSMLAVPLNGDASPDVALVTNANHASVYSNLEWMDSGTGIDRPENTPTVDEAEGFWLSQSFPNPTSDQATVRFELPTTAKVNVAIYDALGRRRAVAVAGVAARGAHELTLSTSDLPSGVYFLRLEARANDGPARVATRQMVVVR